MCSFFELNVCFFRSFLKVNVSISNIRYAGFVMISWCMWLMNRWDYKYGGYFSVQFEG